MLYNLTYMWSLKQKQQNLELKDTENRPAVGCQTWGKGTKWVHWVFECCREKVLKILIIMNKTVTMYADGMLTRPPVAIILQYIQRADHYIACLTLT